MVVDLVKYGSMWTQLGAELDGHSGTGYFQNGSHGQDSCSQWQLKMQ
jgi:hypothetical protein